MNGLPRLSRLLILALILFAHAAALLAMGSRKPLAPSPIAPTFLSASLITESVAPLPSIDPPHETPAPIRPAPQRTPLSVPAPSPTVAARADAAPDPSALSEPTEALITARPEPIPSAPVSSAPPPAAAPDAAPSVPPASKRAEPAEASAPLTLPHADASHLHNPAPIYPAVSRQAGEQGEVVFDVYILPDGSIGELKVRRGSGYRRLDDAALGAVRRWRYVPARRGGQAIAYWYVQAVVFSLQR